jgi:lipopolysaccharide export system protein LptC
MAALSPLRPALNAGADTERLHQSVQGWRRRSRVVSSVRRTLPLLMLAVMVALGWWVYQTTRAPSSQAPTGRVPIRIVNPVFRGQDNGRPFILQAREAVRDGRNHQRIALVRPVMELQEKPGGPPTRITARRGVYREDTLILNLEGDVRYSDALGWRFLTTNAVIDNKRNTVTGAQGIEGDGPSGRFRADAYVIYDQGARVILRGNVKTLSEAQ